MGKKHSQKYFGASSILLGFCKEFLNRSIRLLSAHYKWMNLAQLMKLAIILKKHI